MTTIIDPLSKNMVTLNFLSLTINMTVILDIIHHLGFFQT
jgi:hypothetical protein